MPILPTQPEEQHAVHLPDPWLWFQALRYTAPYQTSMHRHPAWQLTASLEGEFRFRTEKTTMHIRPGEWILMAPGLRHDAGSDSQTASAIQIFFRHFPADLMPEFAGRFNLQRKIALTGSMNLETLRHIRSAFMQHTKPDAAYCRTWSCTLAISFIANALSGLPPGSPLNVSPAIQKALEFMEKHFAEPIGVKDIASIAGLSESRFSVRFSEATGFAPMRYLNTLRLACAQDALLGGSSVEEAAFSSGFSSVQYFCRCFRRETGQTPGEFRAHPFR